MASFALLLLGWVIFFNLVLTSWVLICLDLLATFPVLPMTLKTGWFLDCPALCLSFFPMMKLCVKSYLYILRVVNKLL